MTIGLIGAGHIGSQICAAGRGPRPRRGDQQLARAGDPGHARRRARTERARGDRRGCGEGRRHRRRHRAAQELPGGAGRAARGQDRDRHQQLLPAAGRPHSRARQRVDDHVRAPAGAPADVEGRQGVQPYLRRAAHHRRTAGGLEEPSRAGHRRRRPRRQGHGDGPARPVRLRHGRRWAAEGRVAHPARYARLRSTSDGGGAAKRPRGGEAVRRSDRATAFRPAPTGELLPDEESGTFGTRYRSTSSKSSSG